LRDIQTVAWVAKWYFDVNLFFDLVDKGFLTQNEYDLLVSSSALISCLKIKTLGLEGV
jgi:[protein-PII] uridylyltransferase